VTLLGSMKVRHGGLVVHLDNGTSYLVEKFGDPPLGIITTQEVRNVPEAPGGMFATGQGEIYWCDEKGPLRVRETLTALAFHGAIMNNMGAYDNWSCNCHDFVRGMCDHLGASAEYIPNISVAAVPAQRKTSNTEAEAHSSSHH
jgi:hypothetical protein